MIKVSDDTATQTALPVPFELQKGMTRREEEERLQMKLIETAGTRKEAQILWRKPFDPGHLDWEKRGTTVDK
jgi:hypothetical protein